jgi:type II secretory pathway component PulF
MSPAAKAALYRELEKMTAADFHMDRALSLLLAQKQSASMRQMLSSMQRRLAAGSSIADALAGGAGWSVTPLEASLIAAGESSGRLAEAFGHLVLYFTTLDSARKAASRALIYPLILLHLGIILPEIPAAIANPELGSPALRVSLTILGLWIFLGLGAWLWRALSRLAVGSLFVDGLLNAVPFLGSVRRHWALARFCQVFHATLMAGFRMSKAIELAGGASQSGRLRRTAEVGAAKIESQGQTVGQALSGGADGSAFPTAFLNAVATAEEVGSLDKEMAQWTTLETAEATDRMQRAAIWLPKAGYAVIVLFVVYRILAMVSGYYGSLTKGLDI